MIVFRLLGPVGVEHQPDDSALARVRGVRAVLATLLHHADQYVSADRLADCAWPDPPASAQANLRTQITALRRALDQCSDGLGRRLTTRRGGPGDRAAYRLAARPDEIDAAVFTTLADQGHEHLAGQRPRQAAEALRGALRLWRGSIGEDLPDTPALRAWAAELTERRLTVEDDLAEARLRLADHAGLVAALRRRLAADAHRERTAELLMRALHATGERTAAITAFEKFRSQLVEDLGIEPSARLRQIHIALLNDEPTTETAGATTPHRHSEGTSAKSTKPTRQASTSRRRAPNRPSDRGSRTKR
jgi:DNA-binding SARP family transcriptional activator